MSGHLKLRFPKSWCVISDPAEPHFFSLRAGPPRAPDGCFSCRKKDSYNGNRHFYCTTCDAQFHFGCHWGTRERRHPFHPQHPLSFSFYTPNGTLVSNLNSRQYENPCGDSDSDSGDESYGDSGYVSDGDSDGDSVGESDGEFDGECDGEAVGEPDRSSDDGKCDWCGRNLKSGSHRVSVPFYSCSLCGYSLCMYCSTKYPLLTITNPKNHPHPLTLLPMRLSSLPCNACGLADVRDPNNYPSPAYVCLRCRYVVHECCLNLPRVIKISFHPQHRLSHTPFLPPGQQQQLCYVCYKNVHPKHGAYSCTEGCPYAIHSRCATRKHIWDRKELEWVPEAEHDDIEETQPFKRISDKEIQHFSHENHVLHLLEDDGSVCEDQCQACVLPIDHSGRFYCCMPCRFFLHEACASLPRKMFHKLHHHKLVLDPLLSPQDYNPPRSCTACRRKSCGFMYKCEDESCKRFFMDVKCASSFSDPFNHKSHQQNHLIFIDFQRHLHQFTCQICGRCMHGFSLKCIHGCDLVMCIQCATLPDKVRYKFDDHPLTLSFGEDADGPYWCELCEKQVDPKKWFYTCHKCCTTLHVHCVFGPSIHMKAGRKFKFESQAYWSVDDEWARVDVEVVQNNSVTRPVCNECCDRCQGKVFYKTTKGCFCSLDVSPGCLDNHLCKSGP